MLGFLVCGDAEVLALHLAVASSDRIWCWESQGLLFAGAGFFKGRACLLRSFSSQLQQLIKTNSYKLKYKLLTLDSFYKS